MSATSEKTIEKRICEYAKSKGCMVFKLASMNNRGQPDRMFLFQGRALFLEIKSTGKKPSDLQRSVIKKLRENGFIADWTDNTEKGISVVNMFLGI